MRGGAATRTSLERAVAGFGAQQLGRRRLPPSTSCVRPTDSCSKARGPACLTASSRSFAPHQPDPAGPSAMDTVAPSECKTWVDICFEHLCLQGLVDFVFLIRWCRVSPEWIDALKRAVRLKQQVSLRHGRGSAASTESGCRRKYQHRRPARLLLDQRRMNKQFSD
jgi:hypothetical protein